MQTISEPGFHSEFVSGALRGIGQASGSAWYTSRYIYVIAILLIIYYIHTFSPEWTMHRLKSDSIAYSRFVGTWYAFVGGNVHEITFGEDARTFTRDATDYVMEDPLVYDIAGAPKIRFDAELKQNILSTVFVCADVKKLYVSIDGTKAVTYWKDKRKASH